MSATDTHPSVLLDCLRLTLTEAPPLCNGILKLSSAGDLELYYGRESPRFIDIAHAVQYQDALDELERTCDPAVFGRNQETVLDETYRKAGKMDAENFMTRFDVYSTGLIDAVRQGLLTGPQEKKAIKAELYKLNVYGRGAFFKPHVDTPRADNMFGSLVVIFPTPHEGGELVLRHQDEEWTIDSADLLSGHSDRIAFVAFFSDVEHEVLPVLSGHRITLTYNLYFAGNAGLDRGLAGQLTMLQPLHANPDAIQDALRALLSSKKVLPRGGMLGFSLSHVYPVPSTWDTGDANPRVTIEQGLKGSDAALFQACRALGLRPRLRLEMDESGKRYLFKWMGSLTEQMDDSDDDIFADDSGVAVYENLQTLYESDDDTTTDDTTADPNTADDPTVDDTTNDNTTADDDDRCSEDEDSDSDRDSSNSPAGVYWVTELGGMNSTTREYLRYGNEASISCFYVNVCLVADVKPAKQRVARKESKAAGEPSEAAANATAE
ncbi:hypothetical protein ONZ51_g9269 [Trametes cubensis]|uniref:Fe2OG dioxygenase domain-containing protein n=1 Tax=Trametes cubensis TaxID=1111947 RepID=A0AAD7TP72_9APHY|nr:hypothetical protein ONZ51_g9269 [Trametes cubensis]